MKSKKLVILASIIAILMLAITPISANKPTDYKASGTIDGYVDVYSSVIVGGYWSVTINEGLLQYTAMYNALILDETERSPVGSVDIFTHILTIEDTDDYELKGNVLTFTGEAQVKKIGRKPDWTTEMVPILISFTITVNPTTFSLVGPTPAISDDGGEGPGSTGDSDVHDWDITGTTTNFKN